MSRSTSTWRDVIAGCFVCHGGDAFWRGANAQAVAARHHDVTKHATWCDVAMSIRYGVEAADSRQIDIEDAIAVGQGDRPESKAVPPSVPDALAVPAAVVSAPEGRSSRSALAAAKPEHAHA